jgi:peptide chain release factor 1
VFERLADLAAEHAQLEHDLSDPSILADQDRARKLGRRYGELTPIVQAYAEWKQTGEDEATARELAPEDS